MNVLMAIFPLSEPQMQLLDFIIKTGERIKEVDAKIVPQFDLGVK